MDKFDEKARELLRSIRNQEHWEKSNPIGLIAEALREAQAEAFEEAKDMSWEQCANRASALRGDAARGQDEGEK